MRKVAAQAIVLLKNNNSLLPLKPKVCRVTRCVCRASYAHNHYVQEQGLKKIAIVGGNAKAAVLSGGGSASLKPIYFVSPYEGMVAVLKAADPNVEITYSEGARGQ